MATIPFVGDRLRKQDLFLATLAGLVFTVLYLIFSAQGLDPALWDDMCVAAELRPPQTIFPGAWRLLTQGLLSIVGVEKITVTLRIIGSIVGGLSVIFAYLIIRHTLAFLARARDVEGWARIASLFSFLATACFALSDSMWRFVSPLTPGALQFIGLLISVQLFFRWVNKTGVWRVMLLMFIAGALSAETPIGFLVPLLVYIGYRLVFDAVINGHFSIDGDVDSIRALPCWRMFFSFVAGLVVFAYINISSFASFGGLEVNGWDYIDVAIHYVMGYYGAIRASATPIGWILAITFSVLPLVTVLVLFPMLCRDTKPIDFKLGLILLFSGFLALMQCGVFPYARLWAFTSGAANVTSDFIEGMFAFCIVVTLALSASCFSLGSQNFFEFDPDDGGFKAVERRGFVMRNIALFFVILGMIPCTFRIHRPVETEMRLIVRDALRETVRECGDAKFLFTDGRLDAGLELTAAQLGAAVRPLNMMSGPSAWEKHIRSRHFEKDSADYTSVEMGVPVLLRVWAGEKTNGMDQAAVQLGFEFWKRARRPLPRQSGFVAREKGIDDAEAERGKSAANRLADRILAVTKESGNISVSPELKNALSSVSWRISRFARMRDDDQRANELDDSNEAVKHMMRLVEYERMRTFMQMTPYEGLRLSLRRADFSEARRYAKTVLQMDPDDPEANFGTGMAYLMEEKYKEAEMYLEATLKKRPDEPAVLNNLSIVYRKTNRLEKALEYAKKAHDILPGNEEIAKTLRDIERAIESRKATLKSAFSK